MTSAITRAMTAVPATGDSSAGRNVVTAPSAKIHAFGLTTWNAAADPTPIGRARTAASIAPAWAICHAR